MRWAKLVLLVSHTICAMTIHIDGSICLIRAKNNYAKIIHHSWAILWVRLNRVVQMIKLSFHIFGVVLFIDPVLQTLICCRWQIPIISPLSPSPALSSSPPHSLSLSLPLSLLDFDAKVKSMNLVFFNMLGCSRATLLHRLYMRIMTNKKIIQKNGIQNETRNQRYHYLWHSV